MRVQLSVPPNAPGDEQHFEVGLFRVPVAGARLGRGREGEPLVRITFAGEPAVSKLCRIESEGLAERATDTAGDAFERREDETVSAGGITDARARAIASGSGQVVARGSAGSDGAAGRLELVREPPGRGAAVSIAPAL